MAYLLLRVEASSKIPNAKKQGKGCGACIPQRIEKDNDAFQSQGIAA
jgi:hypothetical protein